MMNRFGEKLRALRKRRGLTQEQISQMLEVSRPYVAKLERGEKMPNAPMIIKIADIFGVTADQLMRDELELD
jgi:transcriptional regulator with XRE-family HTH domain